MSVKGLSSSAAINPWAHGTAELSTCAPLRRTVVDVPRLLRAGSGFMHALLPGLLALLLTACGQPGPGPDQLLLDDVQATVELTRIRGMQSRGSLLTPQDYQLLQQLLQRHPDARRVRESYQAALIQRGDWNSLEGFLLQTAPGLRSDADRLNLAKVYLQQGKHQDFLDSLASLTAEQRLTPEMIAMQAIALFRLGRLDQAAAQLDRHWQTLLDQQRSDAVGIRGQIALHQNDFQRARDLLQQALQWDPDDRSTLLALGRAQHALGATDQASAILARAEALQTQRSRQERQAMRQVELVNALQQQWAAQQYDQVITLARQALEITDTAHHPVLYEYIVESHRRLGQPAQAEAALAEQRMRTP